MVNVYIENSGQVKNIRHLFIDIVTRIVAALNRRSQSNTAYCYHQTSAHASTKKAGSKSFHMASIETELNSQRNVTVQYAIVRRVES